MTALNIGDVAPDRPKVTPRGKGPCPQCGAKPDVRETVTSFGQSTPRVMCGNCAYEFKESER